MTSIRLLGEESKRNPTDRGHAGTMGRMWARPVSSIYTEYKEIRVFPFGEGGGRGLGI